MSTATRLAHPPRAVLIGAYEAGAKGVHPDALCARPGVDEAVIAGLVGERLLYCRLRGREPYYRLTANGGWWRIR